MSKISEMSEMCKMSMSKSFVKFEGRKTLTRLPWQHREEDRPAIDTGPIELGLILLEESILNRIDDVH